MEFESKIFSQPNIPRSLVESMRVGNNVFTKYFSENSAIDKSKIIVAHRSTVKNIQTKDFVAENIIGEMAVEKGLDPSILFIPSNYAYLDHDDKSELFYLSYEYFVPLFTHNRNNIKERKELSDRCIFAFEELTDLLIKDTAEEVPIPPTEGLVEYIEGIVPAFLEQEAQNNPKIDELSKNIRGFLRQNIGNTSFSAEGVRLNVNVNNRKVFTILTGVDQAVRAMLTEPLVAMFVKEMKRKYPWFNPDENYQSGISKESINYLMAIKNIQNYGKIKEYSDLARAYVTSDLGVHTAEEIVRSLLVDKHASDNEEPQYELDEYEEMYEDEELNLNKPRKKTQLRKMR